MALGNKWIMFYDLLDIILDPSEKSWVEHGVLTINEISIGSRDVI